MIEPWQQYCYNSTVFWHQGGEGVAYFSCSGELGVPCLPESSLAHGLKLSDLLC